MKGVLGGQLRPGLLGDHVGGVPVGPVLVVLSARALLVFTVGDGRAEKRTHQVVVGAEYCCGGVDAAGQPGGDFLQLPGVAVGVLEGGVRVVGGMVGVRSGDRTARGVVEDVADIDSGGGQLSVCGTDVGDDQEGCGGSGCSVGQVGAEVDRGVGAGRGELG